MDHLEEKARQLLEYDNIREIYNKVAREAEEKRGPVLPSTLSSTIGSLIYHFGSSPEFKEMREEYREALSQVLRSWKGLEREKGFEQAINAAAESELDRVLSRALEMAQAGHQVLEWPEGLKPEEAREYLAIGNNQAYINFRDKMARGAYSMEPGQWPEADISGGKVKEGKAIVKPDISPVLKEETLLDLQETMKSKVLSITRKGDLAADVFDIITAKWLKEARHHEAMVTISADEIMEARGLQKMKGGSGRRGGYKDEWRQEIAEQIDTLSQHWITIAEMEAWEEVKGKKKKVKWRGEGRALTMDLRIGQEKLDGSIDAYLWKVRPGSIFSEFLYGPGRETALLSSKALHYDYYRQQWEKKLTRYLAYIWRIDEGRTMEGLLVKTLLYRAGGELDEKRPGRTRDRLEKALDQLKDDDVIQSWQYEDIEQARGRQWAKKWIEAKIILEAPAELTKHYLPIRENRKKKLKRGKPDKR